MPNTNAPKWAGKQLTNVPLFNVDPETSVPHRWRPTPHPKGKYYAWIEAGKCCWSCLRPWRRAESHLTDCPKCGQDRRFPFGN